MSEVRRLTDVVDAYIACSNAAGGVKAELILLKYLPDNKPDGKCYDVPSSKRNDLFHELMATVAESNK